MFDGFCSSASTIITIKSIVIIIVHMDGWLDRWMNE